MTVHPFLDQRVYRDAAIVGALEHLCQSLEPSWTQIKEAKARYDAVGAWLTGSSDLGLQRLVIYLQGSTALGTLVRPLFDNEYDVDLVSHIGGHESRSPAQVKKLIGDRLKDNERYRPILREKPRCWRLDYANEFHLDITPSIENPACSNGGELVPDRKLECWKASNPKGYQALFERRAAMAPNFRFAKGAGVLADAQVQPYPDAPRFKTPLCRIVQIEKRHRDVYFGRARCDLAPISIVLTTLTMQSYEWCVGHLVFDSELELLLAVVQHMPAFIERQVNDTEVRWFVWNETTHGENFAEKWNQDPRLPSAFFEWHRQLVANLQALESIEGLDGLGQSLEKSFGGEPARRAVNAITDEISAARAGKKLFAAPRVGLITALGGAAAAAGATAVKANNFYGEPE